MNKTLLNDEIAESIRCECPPWRAKCGLPSNPLTMKRYEGMTPLILNLHSIKRGYDSPWWATYKQWGALQCRIKTRPENVEDGYWGVHVYRPVQNVGNAAIPFVVFNACQVYGKDDKKWKIPSATLDVSEYKHVVKNLIETSQAPNLKTLTDLVKFFRGSGTNDEVFEALVLEIACSFLESELHIPHCDDLTEYRKYRVRWLDAVVVPGQLSYAVAAAENVVDLVLGREDRDGV